MSLAIQCIGAGDWENPKCNLELAAAIDANNADFLEAFALVYESTDEFELAESNFKGALEVGAASRARHNHAAILYAQGRDLEAVSAFREATTDMLSSGRPRVFVNLRLASLQTQETPGSKSVFSRPLLMEPRNSKVLLELTQIELTEGDVAAASGYYRRYRADARTDTACTDSWCGNCASLGRCEYSGQ